MMDAFVAWKINKEAFVWWIMLNIWTI
jgi:hypothetical protein